MVSARGMERCIEAFDAELDYLFASLRRLGAPPGELEDLANEVFLLLVERWPSRGRRRSVRLHLFSLAAQVVARRRGAGGLPDAPESQPLILAALDRLATRRRAVLVLHDLDRVPLADVAAALSMTRLAAALRLRRARIQAAAAVRELTADLRAGSSVFPDLLLATIGLRPERSSDLAGRVSRLQGEIFLLEMLMDEVPGCVYFKDRDSRFTRINRYAAAHYGIASPALAVGRTDFDFFTDEHAIQALRDEQEIIRTGQPLVSIKEKETLPDGKLRWVSTTKLPLRGRDGGVVGTFGLSRSLTECLSS